jgi:ribosomal protein S18 acetylase RimI-like enzyme
MRQMNTRVELVEALPPQELANCDFSFGITAELVAPYQDLLDVHAVTPHQKDYCFDPVGWASGVSARKALIQARVGGWLAGFAAISETWNRMAEIDQIAVDRAYRQQGIAGLLLSAAENWAKGEKFEFIKLETQTNNLAACKTYSRAGFILGGYDRFLYAAGSNAGEVALFWYKALR